MNIYLNNETNFERNGVGFLNDLISAKVTESLNGDYVLEIEYPVDGLLSEYLIEDNIIKSNVGNNNYQLFRIKQVTKDFTTIKVYALHISYDLLNNMLLNVAPTNQNCATFGQWILDNTQIENNFTFESDITNVRSARYIRKNPIEAIMGTEENSMLNLFGGEIERDNFVIKMLSNRGSNYGVKLLFGKNIKSIKITIDITSLYTRIMPIGFDGLMLPEIYIDSPLINDYYTPKITTVEFSNIKYTQDETDESAYHNIEEAYQALRNACFNLFEQGIDRPKINIKIDWLELSKTKQYRTQYANLETVRLGDVITANILGLDYTTKVTKTVYNVLTDSIDKFEIGTLQQSISNSINNTQKEIEKVNVTSILKSATENATNLITSAMGGYVYKTQNELFIMDTDDPSTAQKVWRWNINGLGYSNTGINGPYGIAMTMDGSINANFITSGKINTSLIEGLDSLTLQIKEDVEESLKNNIITSKTIEGNPIRIEDAGEYDIDRFYLEGNSHQEGTPTPDTPQEIEVIEGSVDVEVTNGLDSTDSDYQEKIVTIDLQNNFLAKIGDVYDELDVVTGKLTKRIGKVVLDGSEYWNVANGTFYATHLTNYISSTGVICISDKFQAYHNVESSANVPNNGCCFYVTNATYRLYIRDERFTTANDFKTWLASNNVTVYYVLAEPYELQIDTNSIKLFKGINNISLNANLEPNYVSLTYLVENAWNAQYATKAQLQLTQNNINSVVKDTTSLNANLTNLQALVSVENTNLKNALGDLSNNLEENYATNNSVLTIENSVSNIQTSLNQQIEITKDIQVNGVSKVKTTTGFTFDEDGLTITKTNADTKTNIDEDGMVVYSTTGAEDNEILVADAQGVKAKNVEVRTYLVVGQNSRFQDYETGTGCFYIGE